MDKKNINTNKKKRVISKEKVIRLVVIISVVLITILIAVALGINFINGKKKAAAASEVKVEESISKYGYELTDAATPYYKDLFERLKAELDKSDVDEDNYATLLSQLFICDFYNLNNKVTSSDIGGVQYVYKDYQSDFKKASQSSVYDVIQSNVYGDRKQELPVVSKVTVEKKENNSFKYNNDTDAKAYFITATLSYEKDMGYPTNVNLVIIHSNDKLEVAKMS